MGSGEYSCPLGDNSCVDFGNADNVETSESVQGENDKTNDGEVDESGTCTGGFYIFNGKDERCRSKDLFGGLIGQSCCDRDNVFFGIVECKEPEKVWAQHSKDGKTHLVGDYCDKEVFLIGCVRTKQTHCSFNSKLARIVHEQGRPQIGMSWGTPESPSCRGFTPEEFQRIDFSKIDLSEYFGDLTSQINTSIISNMGTFAKDRVTSFYEE